MSSQQVRIRDIPEVAGELRPIWQDAPRSGPYVDAFDGFRLRRARDTIELEMPYQEGVWLVCYLQSLEGGRSALANGGTFFNKAWQLREKQQSPSYKSFASACPLTSRLVSTGSAQVGDVAISAAPVPTGQLVDGAPEVVTLFIVPDEHTLVGDTLTIQDVAFMAHPVEAASDLLDEIRIYYMNLGEQYASRTGPSAEEWLKAGGSGLETAGEALKLINLVLGGR